MADDLTPTDGLSNIWIELDGFDKHLNSGDADIRFRFVHKHGGNEATLAVLALPIMASTDGFYGMVARAYDDLIAILRQGLFVSDKMRTHYRSETAKWSRP
ncbi:MAG TPA: hypothetical protein VN802_12350 [Stellaceae bacterium]|nr:hypothetical protein [Stellaceae bacterium]